MISSISAPVVSHPTLLPRAEPSSETPSNQTSLADATGSPGTGSDVLSLSQPQSLATNDGFYQRTSLKIRSRSHVKITDDGQVRSMSHTKLRFRYDFEASDGTKIRIRVKANLHYSQFNDGDEGSQSTKLRVKAKVLVLQEGVSTGVAPLLESPAIPSEAKNGITQAIDQFNQITEAATALFLNSDPLDGDSLIAGLVDSFNGLSDSLKSMFLPQPTASEAEPSQEVVELLAPSVSDSEELPTPKPAQIEAIPPVSIEAKPLPEAPPQEIGQSDVPENEIAEVVGPQETSTVENELPLEANELGASSEGQVVATATDEQLPPSVSSVMFKLRLRVVQSLTSLVGVFEPDSPDPQAVHSMFRASAQFTARYGFSESVANGSLTQNSQVDERA